MKCLCNHCSGEIEFKEGYEGESVSCLHCELDTVLYLFPPVVHPDDLARFEEEKKQNEREQHESQIAAQQKSHLRFCNRCEGEIPAATLGYAFGWIPIMLFHIAVPTFFFSYYLSITLVVSAAVLLIVLFSIEACPKCKSTDVFKINTPPLRAF
jgi:hypothetical protein